MQPKDGWRERWRVGEGELDRVLLGSPQQILGLMALLLNALLLPLLLLPCQGLFSLLLLDKVEGAHRK